MGKRFLAAACFFAVITAVLFRQYLFAGAVPFPANLLSSYYQPFITYPHPAFPNGAPNKPMGFDDLRIHYPVRSVAIRDERSGIAPLWNPFAFSGTVLAATYQAALFLPVSALFLLLPQIDAWSIIILLQPLLCAIAMYVFLRQLGRSGKASVFGALAWALSQFAIVWWEEAYMAGYTAMALPVIMLGIARYVHRRDPVSLLIIAAGTAWSVVAGWFQFTLYTAVFAAWFLAWNTAAKKSGLRTLFAVGVAAAAGLLLSGVHLVPALESLANSARSGVDAKAIFDTYLQPISHIAALLAPDVFGTPATYTYSGAGFYYETVMHFSVPALLLTVVAFAALRRRDIDRWFWALSFLVFLSLGFALPTSRFLLYSLKIPIISVLIPSRIFLLSVFAGSVLAAFGLDDLRTMPKKRIVFSVLFLGLGYAVLWWTMRLPLAQRNLILPTVVFLAGAATVFFLHKRSVAGWSLIALLLIQQGYAAQKYLYFSDRRLVFPETPVTAQLRAVQGYDRIWSFGEGRIENNFASQYGLYSPEGYDSLYIARYGELLAAANDNGIVMHKLESRADAFIRDTNRVDFLFSSFYRKRILSLLGVRYIAGLTRQPKDVTETVRPPDRLRQVWTDGKYAIYENGYALPRAFVTGSAVVIGDGQKILDTLFSPLFDPSSAVILERDPGVPAGNEAASGSAAITAYGGNRVRISAISDRPAFLVLSDPYYPGWKASVDGKPVAIYRADYALRAVRIPQGSHTVEFSYDPVSWKLGLLSSAAGAVMTVLFVAGKRRRNGKKR